MNTKSRRPAGKAEEKTKRSSETVVPGHLPKNSIFTLQQNVGNQNVQRLLESRTIQAKLEIGQPN